MPKLKVTDENLERLAAQAVGAPILMAPDGELVRPGMHDPWSDAPCIGQWRPANDAAKHVFLCRETGKDILEAARQFDRAPFRRLLKQMTVPLVSLLDHLVRLLDVTNRPGSAGRVEREAWPEGDRRHFDELARAVRRHKDGPVRKVRNKVGAHLDESVLGGSPPVVSAETILPVLGDCVALLLLLTNYRNAYVWIRSISVPGENVVETFFDYPAVVRWLTDADGNALAARISYLAADPRHELFDTFQALYRLYNALAEHAKCGLRILTLGPMEYSEGQEPPGPGDRTYRVMMACAIQIDVGTDGT